MNKLENYTLVYSITAIPNILFANVTNAAEPLSFNHEKFTIPGEIKASASTPVEVRIYLFNPEGNLIEMTSNNLPASAKVICQTAELSGLKMSKKVLDSLAHKTD